MKSLVNIYLYRNYKIYLEEVEKQFNKRERGFRSRIAESLGIQSAFVSKVLNLEIAHFSIEQAIALAQFLELNTSEKKYFIWLVECARSGNKETREFFADLIQVAQDENANIKNRVGSVSKISDEDQARFYSHWTYIATHVLISIPQYQTPAALAKILNISEAQIWPILNFLTKAGVLIEQKSHFTIGKMEMHLPKDSPNIIKHHFNCRLKALEYAAIPTSNDIHYSTLSSISREDYAYLKQEMLDLIQRYVDKVRPSKEEVAICFNLDFFKFA